MDKPKVSYLKTTLGMLKLVSPLIKVMVVAVGAGVVGFLASIFLIIFGVEELIGILERGFSYVSLRAVVIIAVLGIMRGILRYIEQYSNHYVAFRLLAIIRSKVFKSLRRLCPAKLEVKNKGNLISMITTDIELMEVFYAHTISPVIIAFLVSIIMLIYMGAYDLSYSLIGLSGYILVGVIIPYINSRLGKQTGIEYRRAFGELNSFIYQSLRGLREIRVFRAGKEKSRTLMEKSEEYERLAGGLNKFEVVSSIITDTCIYGVILAAVYNSFRLYNSGVTDMTTLTIPVIAIMSSFGPVVALSALSNNLMQTMASADRVLSIIAEEPVCEDIVGQSDIMLNELKVDGLSFGYDSSAIVDNISLDLKVGEILGLKGKSGCGKSTLIKLLMRFWERDKGEIDYNDISIDRINTDSLRDNQSYVTQETYIFKDTIRENLKIANPDATEDEMIEACSKASIHDFIMSLDKGYDTYVAELGESLSGGEKQRLGLARAFLHDARMILLDEPTSNIDALNEAFILKSIKQKAGDRAVILVSHKASSLAIADEVLDLDNR